MKENFDMTQDFAVTHIDEAIEKGYIKVYYQPVIRAVSKKLCGMEALARWIDPEKGFMSPGEFIPSLEKSGEIYKLDSYIIEKVCENYSIQSRQNNKVIPVSFNLSRIDFFKTDIFRVVEDAVKKYDVPRDMVNIEITESLFVKDADKIGREIKRFRDAGYLVWMDDFGSGYSSLNVLKDYEFDELKIDMAFLSTFNERSRKIILSIVYMAKLIGIQTLAEGVETEEQYEFLRKTGCEKIQGYYFGKPLPYADSVKQCEVKGVDFETRSWRSYYDEIGKVNFLTDSPLAIVEYDGKDFSGLFANKSYFKSLESFGAYSKEQALDNINDSKNFISKTFRKYIETLSSSDKMSETYYYATGKQYARLDVKIIFSKKERTAFEVALYNLSSDQDKKARKKLDKSLRLVLSMYDDIFIVNMEDERIEPLISAKGVHEFDGLNEDFFNSLNEYTNKYVYPEDRERYITFCKFDNSQRNFAEKNTQFLSEYFRMKDTKGNYTWKVVSLIQLPDAMDKKIIHCEKIAAIDDMGVVQELLKNFGYTECEVPERLPKERDAFLNEGDFFESLMHMTSQNYFWKDSERRFLGASDHFLKSYGIESVDEIIGKTDEEMNWHIDGVRYREAEEEIISKGTSYENVPGQCLIKGTVHHIFASKFPVYKDGKIVGLIGSYDDAEEYNSRIQNNIRAIMDDDVTGLMNMRGTLSTIVNYTDQYIENDEDFEIIALKIPELKRTLTTYGKDILEEVQKVVAGIILKNIKTNGCAGRISGDTFIIISKDMDKDKLFTLKQNLMADVQEIHKVKGERVTFFAKVDMWAASELESLDEIIKKFVELK